MLTMPDLRDNEVPNQANKIGGILTGLYLIFVSCVVFNDWSRARNLSLNEIGDFLAGAFAPLAFLWLVLGFYQQRYELAQNTRMLKLQADELQETVKQQKEMAEVARLQLRRDRPHFVVDTAKHYKKDEEGDFRSVLTLRNTGLRADDVVISTREGLKLEYPEKDRVSLPTWAPNQELDFYISETAVDPIDSFTVSYRDIYGEDVIQEFLVKHKYWEDRADFEVLLFEEVVHVA